MALHVIKVAKGGGFKPLAKRLMEERSFSSWLELLVCQRAIEKVASWRCREAQPSWRWWQSVEVAMWLGRKVVVLEVGEKWRREREERREKREGKKKINFSGENLEFIMHRDFS